MVLHCNTISHWLGAYTEWSLVWCFHISWLYARSYLSSQYYVWWWLGDSMSQASLVLKQMSQEYVYTHTLTMHRGRFHFFIHRNSNLMEISCCAHPSCVEVIATKFCTWHDSWAVVPCAKFNSDILPYNEVTVKIIFHQIWIMMEKSFVKWAPGLCFVDL